MTESAATHGVRVVLHGGNLGTGMDSPVAPDGSFSFADILPGIYSARLRLSGHVIKTSINDDNDPGQKNERHSSTASTNSNEPALLMISEGEHNVSRGQSRIEQSSAFEEGNSAFSDVIRTLYHPFVFPLRKVPGSHANSVVVFLLRS